MNTLHFHTIEQLHIELQRSPYSWFVLFPQYERVLYYGLSKVNCRTLDELLIVQFLLRPQLCYHTNSYLRKYTLRFCGAPNLPSSFSAPSENWTSPATCYHYAVLYADLPNPKEYAAVLTKAPQTRCRFTSFSFASIHTLK